MFLIVQMLPRNEFFKLLVYFRYRNKTFQLLAFTFLLPIEQRISGSVNYSGPTWARTKDPLIMSQVL